MLTKFDMRDFCVRLLFAVCSHRYRRIKRPIYVQPFVCFAVHSVSQLLQVNIVHHHATVSTDRFVFCWHATVRHHDVSAVNYKLHPTVRILQSFSAMAWSAYGCWVCQTGLKLQTESLQIRWIYFRISYHTPGVFTHCTTLRQITWSM